MTALRWICLFLLAPVFGCASDPKTDALDWLYGGQRTVVVVIDDRPPAPSYQVHESRAGAGAAKGAGRGAGAALGGGAQSGEPAMLILGILLMPVFALGGAVAGAATAEPNVQYHGLDEVEGAAALFEAAAQGPDLWTLLRRNIEGRTSTWEGHAIEVADGKPRAGPDIAHLKIAILDYALVGEMVEDPPVRLFVAGFTRISVPQRDGWYICDWSFKGARRKVSEWSAKNAVAFRSELHEAADSIADITLATLEKGPGKCRAPPE